MLLKTSISNTKKFIKRSIQSFKSLFSHGATTYQRLPKKPPCSPFAFACSGGDSDSNIFSRSYGQRDAFYPGFKNEQDESQKKDVVTSKTTPSFLENEGAHHIKPAGSGSIRLVHEKENTGYVDDVYRYEGKECHEGSWRRMTEERTRLVIEKLREFERMDENNAVDIEEVIHFYPQITCPTYRDILDKFFLQMCSELFETTRGYGSIGRIS